MMTRRLLALTLVVLLAAPLAAEEPKTTGPMKVPFELLKSRHMAVQIKLNGKGPYRLVFDTGAPMMLVGTKIARESGIIDKNARTPAFALFGAMGQSSIKEFEMGGLKAENVAAVVMDHPTVAAMAQMFGPLDGIVGFPFFARYRMTIDYQAKEMTFEPVDYEPSNIFDSLMNMMANPQRNRSVGPTILAPAGYWGFVADKKADDEDAGVDVTSVRPDSPVARAGLKAGDRLLTLDGRWTDSVVDLFDAAARVKPGQAAPLKVKRDGKEIDLQATPAKGL